MYPHKIGKQANGEGDKTSSFLFSRRNKKMITITIPKNGTAPDIKKEIMSANNIKCRTTRHNTLSGL